MLCWLYHSGCYIWHGRLKTWNFLTCALHKPWPTENEWILNKVLADQWCFFWGEGLYGQFGLGKHRPQRTCQANKQMMKDGLGIKSKIPGIRVWAGGGPVRNCPALPHDGIKGGIPGAKRRLAGTTGIASLRKHHSESLWLQILIHKYKNTNTNTQVQIHNVLSRNRTDCITA